MTRYPWTKLILTALFAAGSLAAQDEGGPEVAKNPDPQIAKEIDDFKTAAPIAGGSLLAILAAVALVRRARRPKPPEA